MWAKKVSFCIKLILYNPGLLLYNEFVRGSAPHIHKSNILHKAVIKNGGIHHVC